MTYTYTIIVVCVSIYGIYLYRPSITVMCVVAWHTYDVHISLFRYVGLTVLLISKREKKDVTMKKKNNIILGLTPYEGDLTQSLSQDDILGVPDGVPAFENATKFTLITTEDIQPFLYLKSVDIEDLGFVCIDPFLIYPDYLVKISAADMATLQLKDPKDALVFCFVTVKPEPKDNSANLLAPIIINIQNRKGKQVILENYPVKFNIWDGLDKINGGESC